MKPLALLKSLEMGLETTIDFKGKKHIDILTSGRESYRISIILSVVGIGYKLPPLLIIKGEPGKSIEKELRTLPYVRDKKIFIYCQHDAWCTSSIFKEWVNIIFKPYEKEYGDKCLLIMDKAASHVSKESILFLEEKKIEYVLIPSGLTPECQPLDISVNKVFKDNVKYFFEKDRLFYDNLDNKIKLKQARLNIIDYITRVWYDDNIITPSIITHGFKKADIINNVYTTSEEDKIRKIYEYDLYNEIINIEDDLGISLNINPNDLEKNLDSEDENFEDGIDTEKKILDEDDKMKIDNFNQESLDYKKTLNDLENKFSLDNSSKMDLDSD